MRFFFVRDHRRKYRYFSVEPVRPAQIKFSKPREAWELAKKKLMVLPQRTLRQEQAFERALRLKGLPLRIVHSSALDENKTKLLFTHFLQRQRTIHALVLVCESLLLPLSGLTVVLPGPNILFYALALLMITQWQALRGINRSLKTDPVFIADELLASWERAVQDGRKERFPEILECIGKEHGIPNIQGLLWTKKPAREKRDL